MGDIDQLSKIDKLAKTIDDEYNKLVNDDQKKKFFSFISDIANNRVSHVNHRNPHTPTLDSLNSVISTYMALYRHVGNLDNISPAALPL